MCNAITCSCPWHRRHESCASASQRTHNATIVNSTNLKKGHGNKRRMNRPNEWLFLNHPEDIKDNHRCILNNFLRSYPFFVGSDQAAQWTVPSICLSVCPSVRHTLLQCFSHRIIMKFARLITIKRSDVHAKGQGQKSSIKVTEVKTNFAPSWAFPDRNFSLNSQKTTGWFTKLEAAYNRCPIVFKDISQISRSHRTKIANIYLNWADCSSSCNSPMASKWCRNLRWHK